MRTLGNIIWVVFGGLEIALCYLVYSLFLMITIIGIPFGLQTLKLGVLALWPFGKEVITNPTSGCLNTGMNVLWLFTGNKNLYSAFLPWLPVLYHDYRDSLWEATFQAC